VHRREVPMEKGTSLLMEKVCIIIYYLLIVCENHRFKILLFPIIDSLGNPLMFYIFCFELYFILKKLIFCIILNINYISTLKLMIILIVFLIQQMLYTQIN